MIHQEVFRIHDENTLTPFGAKSNAKKLGDNNTKTGAPKSTRKALGQLNNSQLNIRTAQKLELPNSSVFDSKIKLQFPSPSLKPQVLSNPQTEQQQQNISYSTTSEPVAIGKSVESFPFVAVSLLSTKYYSLKVNIYLGRFDLLCIRKFSTYRLG
jgi:hypothetical protein